MSLSPPGRPMRLRCKHCHLEKEFETFEEVIKENKIQCWVTLKGVSHHYNQFVVGKVR